MDLDEFKEAITCKNPLFNDWRFGAKVNVPLVKILPETLKTEEDLAKLIRYELEEKAGIEKFAKTAMEWWREECRRADERARKHRIFIACRSYSDFPKYCNDLIYELRKYGIENVRASIRDGEVETDHVIAKMIPPMMNQDGLRCDECFGFGGFDSFRLKGNGLPGYSELTKVPAYIQKIEKERAKEMFKPDAYVSYRDFRRIPNPVPTIKNVIFNDPATIVMWSDGTKTVVKAENEPFDPEKGLAMAYVKKFEGNQGNYYNLFRKWLPEKKDD